jgi:hypothetical protein
LSLQGQIAPFLVDFLSGTWLTKGVRRDQRSMLLGKVLGESAAGNKLVSQHGRVESWDRLAVARLGIPWLHTRLRSLWGGVLRHRCMV